jgi:sugar lactone lactonase YvrE
MLVFSLLWLAMFGTAASAATTFLGGTSKIGPVSSTAPGNDDINPYGVAVVPRSVGDLTAGDVLVSNFNNMMNQQGTGTTIVEISPDGTQTVFARIDPKSEAAQDCGGVGLTTALSVLRKGWVIVGSLPTTNGMSPTATAGCLFVLDRHGHVARVIRGGDINGPWDMTTLDQGKSAVLFVTNVLNGTVAGNGAVVNHGSVVRIRLSFSDDHAPRVRSERIIGSGFAERTDPNALVVGPTGVALAPDGTLYVADTVSNRIAAIPDALDRHRTAFTGTDVSSNGALNGPLGMALALNGDILTVNAGDGLAVETNPSGTQVASKMLDSSGMPPGAGALFGLAVAPDGKSLYFVDDATNFLNLLH